MSQNRQRIYRSHALILRRRDYREADRILTVFTPNRGKLQLIAKGIRKTNSRKAGHLELFTHTALMLAEGRTWDVVTEANTVESFRRIRDDLERISQAGYLCELVDAFSESDDENQPLWELLLAALRVLNEDNGPCDGPMLLRWFTIHLLSLTGFQPQFFHCIACESEIQPVLNRLDLAAGGVICPNCAAQFAATHSSNAARDPRGSNVQESMGLETIEPDVLKILRFLQRNSWGEVARLQLRAAIAGLVDSILHRYLILVLERHIRSGEFIRRLQHLAATAHGAIAASATSSATNKVSTSAASLPNAPSGTAISTDEAAPAPAPD